MKLKASISGLAVPISHAQRVKRTIVTGMLVCAVAVLSCWLTAFRAWSADCVLPPDGLVAWWPGEGNANDIVGTNNGTLRGGATFASGKVGRAFDFDGSGSVLVPDAPALRFTNAVTIEAWIYPKSEGSAAAIVCKWFGNGNQFSYSTAIESTGKAYILVSSDGLTSTPSVDYQIVYSTNTVPLNQWTHFAGVYDGAWLKVYLNGVLENRVAWTKGIFPGTAPLVIGEALYQSALTGLIDEPTLYSRALSDTEIQEIYNAGSAGKCSGPVITSQPRGQVGYWGKNVTFSVSAVGRPSLYYQWLKDNAPIGGPSGSSLVLTNLQLTDAGDYSVVVTNAYGSATSSNAYLTMNPAGVSLALYAGITIEGVVGLTYGIQYSTDLSNTNSWHGMANVTLGAPTQLWFDIQPASQPQRYYRVVPGPITVP
jgi:Concanavalin A-like lectin/glucanases superfamily/Immunoglobulin domain